MTNCFVGTYIRSHMYVHAYLQTIKCHSLICIAVARDRGRYLIVYTAALRQEPHVDVHVVVFVLCVAPVWPSLRSDFADHGGIPSPGAPLFS